MKNILFITSEFPPLPGGIGNHACALTNYLYKSGYEMEVLSDFRSKEKDIEFDRQQQFAIYRVGRNKFTQLNRIMKALLLAKSKDTIICSGKFSLWIGGVLKSIYSKKNVVAVLHGSEIRAGGTMSKALIQWSLKRFDTLIAVSNFTKKITLQYNPNLKVEVINNGFAVPQIKVDVSKIKDLSIPKIVTVGNVTFRKGQQNVIKALPLIKKYFPEIQYHCIGIPTEKEAFMELALQFNVQEHVIFHGALSTTDFIQVLKESAVFFMLSDVLENGDFEGFGIAILEANALGIPAIGSNNSGIKDAVKTGFSGELVDPKNQDEVVEAFLKIINNYESYSKNAIEWSSHFTWDIVGKKYIQILEK